MKRTIQFINLTVLIILFSSGQSLSQTMWTKYHQNPVFYSSSVGWDDRGVMAPHVIKDVDTLKMWYTGFTNSPYYDRIGYAVSSDGITWQRNTQPVLIPDPSPHWDSYYVLAPFVLKEGDTLKMWYVGTDVTFTTYTNLRIGYATSVDGENWDKHPDPVLSPGPANWDNENVGSRSVLFYNNSYHMWYTGNEYTGTTGNRIGYATSPDGINWTKYSGNPVFSGSGNFWDADAVFGPHVIKDGDTLKMWYTGSDGQIERIGYAISLDSGLTWVANNMPVLNIGAPGQWDYDCVQNPCVIMDGLISYMWYDGYNTPNYWNLIGLATDTTSPRVINVPADVPTIQAGIDSASTGNIVLVEEGTYYENINFKGKAVTVASHFLIDGDTSHINNTIIDGSQPSNPDSGSVVTFSSGCDTNSVLMGFTITGGTGKRFVDSWGGIFRQGGGVDVLLSGAKIESNRIVNNHIPNTISYQGFGAGISVYGESDEFVIISNNEIVNNSLTSTSHTYGAGVTMGTSGTIRFTENLIEGNINTATGTRLALGGGMYAWGGTYQGISFNGDIIISDNLFKNNHVSAGTGTFLPQGGGGIYIDLCSPKIINNLILNNDGQRGGGVLVCGVNRSGLTGEAKPILINNTINGNFASMFGGGLYSHGSPTSAARPEIKNSILWGDSALNGPEIYNLGVVDAVYSNIEGGFTGYGNIDFDPFFHDSLVALNDTMYCCLSSSSPSIDAGNPDPSSFDIEDPQNQGYALWPAMGTLRNDMGAYGGHGRTDITVGLKTIDDKNQMSHYQLLQNYPNPFNPSTTIQFDLLKTSEASLKIFNLLGEEIATLLSAYLPSGSYTYEWDASNFASGVYLYRLEAGNYVETRKMVLMK